MLDEILAYNKQFVENKGYEKYITNKYPDKKIAILSCMDTRLTKRRRENDQKCGRCYFPSFRQRHS